MLKYRQVSITLCLFETAGSARWKRKHSDSIGERGQKVKEVKKNKAKPPVLDIQMAVKSILATIEREREREIIAKRFGLFTRRETLEQIGESLNITRERVRQLEKSIMANLKYNPHNKLPHMEKVERVFVKLLKDLGNVARVKDLGARLNEQLNDHIHQSRVTFLGALSPKFVLIKADDLHHHGIGLADVHDHQALKSEVSGIVKHIAETGEPVTTQQIHANMKKHHGPQHVHALATISKKLAHLNHRWGLSRWPTVNPKNIRDKIFIILRDNGKPMHFSKIAEAIRQSNFERNQVTVQAIHNELIKDHRFILVGRGIYALQQWGYKKGTVADVIYEILEDAGKPLHRDEIVQGVLALRQVKQTTILLNLQCKPIFKRLPGGKYILDES